MLKTRKRKMAFGLALLLLAAAVAAAVIWLLRAPVTGGGSVNPTEPQDISVSVTGTGGAQGATCVAPIGGNDVQVNGDRGGRCRVDFRINNPNSAEFDLVVQDFRFAKDWVTVQIDPGVTGCGELAPDGSSFRVWFEIKADAGTVHGANFTVDSDAGLYLVDQGSYVAGDCPSG